MSQKNESVIRKNSRDVMTVVDRRQTERDRTLQRRQARHIKAIIRTV